MAFTITERTEPVVPGAKTQKLILEIDPPIEEMNDDDLRACAGSLWATAFDVRDRDWKKAFVYDDSRAAVLAECVKRGLAN